MDSWLTRQPGLIVTRTPLRISFAGGGTDLPAFCEREPGAALSTAINKYVYVSMKRHGELFGEPVRLNYSETEMVRNVVDIKNDIIRECLRFLEIDPPIYINTVADIPAASGLGSSSAFAVGLMNALYTYIGRQVSPGQLAHEAAHIEMTVLKRPIGKQDHYAAAYGGMNLFRFLSSGEVSVQPQHIEDDERIRLFGHMLLFWTGISRDSHSVLNEQKERTNEHLKELETMRDQAEILSRNFTNGLDIAETGAILDEAWKLKRRLASRITNEKIDAWYEIGRKAGALGGKLCGAGGGGFLVLLVPPEKHEAVRAALKDLEEVQVDYEPLGSRLLMPHME